MAYEHARNALMLREAFWIVVDLGERGKCTIT
jgi:hypothetical protein